MKAKIQIGNPDSFIDVSVDEDGRGKFENVAAKDANRLLTRADAVEESEEDQPSGTHLALPNAIGLFAPGPNVKFEYNGVQKTFTFSEIPYEQLLDNSRNISVLGDVFLKRIKAVRSWTDQQIELKCEKVDVEKFGNYDDQSSKLFSKDSGKLNVLVQYIITKGPNCYPNIEIFLNGIKFKYNWRPSPKDLDEVTDYLIANGARSDGSNPHNHLGIFTPQSPKYRYGGKIIKTMYMDEIDYCGDPRKIESRLSKRIQDFRKDITDGIEVQTSFARKKR